MRTELKKNEKIIHVTKLHWFVLLGPFFIFLLGSGAAVLIGIYSESTYPYYAILLFLTYFWYKTVERNNDIWVVTTLRVIDEYGVFTNNSKESPLDKINNMSYSQTFWGKIFGFGNVQIQTAAEIGSTEYHQVANPKKLKDTITRMQEEYKQNQVKDQAKELANAILANQQNNPSNKVDVSVELEKLLALKEKGALTQSEFDTLKAKLLA